MNEDRWCITGRRVGQGYTWKGEWAKNKNGGIVDNRKLVRFVWSYGWGYISS